MSDPVRIGIDARELLGATTGVGRYLGELLQRWTSRPDAGCRRFLLFTPEPLALPLPPGTCDVRVVGNGRGTWWEQTHLRRTLGGEALDAFFAPAYTAPLHVPAPLAVTIHDVSFAAHPEWFRPREGMRRRWLTRRAAHAASVIFTVSAFSAREIAQRLQVDPARIQVVPNGLTPRRSTGAAGRRRDPLVLYAGSLFNRRRVPDLIAAFALATRDLPQARLAIVGDDRTWPPQDLPGIAAAQGVAGRVDFHRYLPDADLDALYQRAAAFAFLSEYEGFGLTPLEALSAGVPAVVLDTEVAREVYGDAAIYVQPGDIDGTAAALEKLLTDPGAGAAALARAPEVLARYSWDAAAERTLAHLDRIARR